MKTIYKKTGQYIVLLSLIFASCNNNLDEVVYSELTEESYTYTNAYQAIGVAYANMRGLISHQNFYMVQETSADAIVMPANASGWDDGGIYRRMHEHTWNSESMQMNNMWNTLYAGV
ncbi:MAG: RagB/SusD family nutrient uptake outer membrane protein, partial [Parapedobacter sp.]